ncbi:hypothetical protein [Paludisphaera borealis]|uniref:Uncharacterized protein n=1 Tax=Paludisphaera borealis TaxID=1387353 RepID=A0A1U7CY40_9BACT|nr:hypothetical protein [Paludisphaera borealis]APW63816.1 hypothetical protein BSF38_05393 [Paludisphaera borealis]
MWPKVIYIFPSAIVALICSLGMVSLQNKTYDPSKETVVKVTGAPSDPAAVQSEVAHMTKLERFRTPQNLLGVLFLTVLAFNLIVMALDFPRFELVGVILAVLFTLFFLLWIGAYFNINIMKPINKLLEQTYMFANAGFYFLYFLMVVVVLGVVYITRWLDYWEILPNEILHHHGPLSDLERFPTMNLKFDKEIPDVLEFWMLGAGRLVMHVPNVDRAIIMDNVLFINAKEDGLKKLMSRLDVRISTDQDVTNLPTS